MEFKFEDIISVGDLHGHWEVVIEHINRYDIKNTLYLCVGDFGVGTHLTKNKEFLLKLNDTLKSSNNSFFTIRGNHDDPEWFVSGKHDDFKKQLSNILFIEDYSILNINDENYLFIGGAHSVDRVARNGRGLPHWEDEVVRFDYDFCETVSNIDRMFCHTSPMFCPPIGPHSGFIMDNAESDPSLLQDIYNERTQMTKIVDDIMANNKLKTFHYGHFHKPSKITHNGCEFICLDINEFSMINY